MNRWLIRQVTSLPVSSGGRGRSDPDPDGRLDHSPVAKRSPCSFSRQKHAELQDDAGQGHSAGRLAVHLHCGGETGGERVDRWREGRQVETGETGREG